MSSDKPYAVLEVDRVVVDGVDRDYEVDRVNRIVSVRRDLSPAQMAAAGFAQAIADAREVHVRVFDLKPPADDTELL
jgi:hypothetical protein